MVSFFAKGPNQLFSPIVEYLYVMDPGDSVANFKIVSSFAPYSSPESCMIVFHTSRRFWFESWVGVGGVKGELSGLPGGAIWRGVTM